jgi:hypothetical protein
VQKAQVQRAVLGGEQRLEVAGVGAEGQGLVGVVEGQDLCVCVWWEGGVGGVSPVVGWVRAVISLSLAKLATYHGVGDS